MKVVGKAFILFTFLSFYFAAIFGGQKPNMVSVINNVTACSNGDYTNTIKLFFLGNQQMNVGKGMEI